MVHLRGKREPIDPRRTTGDHEWFTYAANVHLSPAPPASHFFLIFEARTTRARKKNRISPPGTACQGDRFTPEANVNLSLARAEGPQGIRFTPEANVNLSPRSPNFFFNFERRSRPTQKKNQFFTPSVLSTPGGAPATRQRIDGRPRPGPPVRAQRAPAHRWGAPEWVGQGHQERGPRAGARPHQGPPRQC